MNASELIEAMHQLGAALVVEDGIPRVRGRKLPDELLAALRANKPAVLAEWERRQGFHRQRHGLAPEGDVPLTGQAVALTGEQRAAVVAYVFPQPRPVHGWVMVRSNAYFERTVPADECDGCACLDVLTWQCNLDALRALEWLRMETTKGTAS